MAGSLVRGRRGVKGAYTKIEDRIRRRLKVGKQSLKNTPGDRRIYVLLSPVVEDEARCRIRSGDEDIRPTPDGVLPGWTGSDELVVAR
jgi:hypothetical protein